MKRIVSLLAAAFLAAPGLALAGLANDEVTSQKLKEADGTSGQNTNLGAGVKTGHLQDQAVTTSKVADGAITGAKLAPGAVTEDRISGVISAAKLGAHGHYPTDLVGAVPADKIQAYARELIVHQGPADGISTFNSVVAAQAAAAVDGWTRIRIMPGVYEETASISLDKSVVFEGSGAESTVIHGALNQANPGYRVNVLRNVTFSGGFSWGALVLDQVVSDGQVFTRFGLTIRDSRINGNVGAMGLLNVRDSAVYGSINVYDAFSANSIVDVTVTPAAGAYEAILVMNGASPGNTPSAVTLLQGVRTTAAGTNGLSATQGVRVQVRGSTLLGASQGIAAASSGDVVDVRDSEVGGATASIVTGAGTSLAAVNTQLSGPLSGGGVLKVVNCFDAGFNPLPNQ